MPSSHLFLPHSLLRRRRCRLLLFLAISSRLHEGQATFNNEQYSSLSTIDYKQFVTEHNTHPFTMVIFMPYYRQHGQLMHSHPRARPIPSSSAGHHHANAGTGGTAATAHMSACKFASSILCRFTFSLFLFAIALFLFQLSVIDVSNKKEGSNIIAAILLTIAIVSFLRTCQTLRRYLTIMHTRRRLIQVQNASREICRSNTSTFVHLLSHSEITWTATSLWLSLGQQQW